MRVLQLESPRRRASFGRRLSPSRLRPKGFRLNIKTRHLRVLIVVLAHADTIRSTYKCQESLAADSAVCAELSEDTGWTREVASGSNPVEMIIKTLQLCKQVLRTRAWCWKESVESAFFKTGVDIRQPRPGTVRGC